MCIRDRPWNGNVWYEYDWELRGRLPSAGWSQIRVRNERGARLIDAPVNVSSTTNLGNELLHYILIRKDDRYVYDIRRNFDIRTYNFNDASAHGRNSASLLSNGPRIFETGGRVDHIPSYKRLDFSLGITAFDNSWASRVSAGDFSREVEVDFTRFHTYSGNNLNSSPQWSDEFNGNSLDRGKWFEANWSFAATQFRPDNVRLANGRLYLKINRGQSNGNDSSQNLALNGSASQSSTSHGGVANRAIDGNQNGVWRNNSVTHTNSSQKNAWWQVRLAQTSNINQIIVHNRQDNCCVSRLSNYTVSVLDDNNNMVWSRTYGNAPTPTQAINLSTRGRTVRVSLNGTLSLAEVEVIGTN